MRGPLLVSYEWQGVENRSNSSKLIDIGKYFN
jgi:hypothetical protein